MDFDDFGEVIKPENWIVETTLSTPTFQATLKQDGSLYLSGAALKEGFSPEAVQALTRFLLEQVTLPAVEPPYDFNDFTPKKVEE